MKNNTPVTAEGLWTVDAMAGRPLSPCAERRSDVGKAPRLPVSTLSTIELRQIIMEVMG